VLLPCWAFTLVLATEITSKTNPMYSASATIEKTGRSVLGVLSLLFGKNRVKSNVGEIVTSMKPEVSLNPPKTLIVLNKTSYCKIGNTWYQLASNGARISLTHFENYSQIEQLLDGKAKEHVC
jgi:hypothetical protein